MCRVIGAAAVLAALAIAPPAAAQSPACSGDLGSLPAAGTKGRVVRVR
jgi:hypothetical protein